MAVAAQLREATHTVGAASRLGGGPCLEKALFPEQNYSARESLRLPSSGSLGFNSYPSDHFHASNVKERKEVGSETNNTVICLVTILPLGWEGTATWRTWPGVSSLFLQAVPASYPVLGRGIDEDGGCGEENVDLPGSQDLSERGLRGGGGGR